MQSWKDELKHFFSGAEPDPRSAIDMKQANGELIRKVMLGFGPDAARPDARTGQRLVFNVSSAHVPAVMLRGYFNTYDLKTIVGTRGPSRLRMQIDGAIAALGTGIGPKDIYFGAVELNGTGIRYFGDFCVVLTPDDRSELMLITNSYDVHRDPTRSSVFLAHDPIRTSDNRVATLRNWAGNWPQDAPDMVVLKLAALISSTRRRLTTGTIAANVLADEDYIEVARNGSFKAPDIEEIRLSPADAAADARIGDRSLSGPTPSLAEALWRKRRRGAELASAQARITTRVVVTSGRDRG